VNIEVENMKISVAMATYNGSRYIREQLESIAAQTRQPDELIVSDDGSTDETTSIVRNFAKNVSFEVILLEHQERLGVSKNFEQAIARTSGELVFLCDQDDIWFPEKIAVMTEYFTSHPGIHIAIHDCKFLFGDGNMQGGSMTKNAGRIIGGQADHVQGCCTVATKKLMEISFPLPSLECGTLGFDGHLHAIGYDLEVRAVVDQSLQLYRRHDSNISQSLLNSINQPNFGARQTHLLRKLFQLINSSSERLEILQQRNQLIKLVIERLKKKNLFEEQEASSFLNKLYSKSKALEQRCKIIKINQLIRPIPAAWLYLRGGYRNFSGFKSLLVDMLL